MLGPRRNWSSPYAGTLQDGIAAKALGGERRNGGHHCLREDVLLVDQERDGSICQVSVSGRDVRILPLRRPSEASAWES